MEETLHILHVDGIDRQQSDYQKLHILSRDPLDDRSVVELVSTSSLSHPLRALLLFEDIPYVPGLTQVVLQ